MPYVRFHGEYAAFIAGRDVDSALHYEDASGDLCIGIVGEQRAGDEVVDQAAYEADAATIGGYNATIPPPPAPGPSPQDVARAAVAAVDLDSLPDAATRRAFKALRDHVLGEPTLDPEGVWAQHKERRSPAPAEAEKPWR